VGPGLAIVLSSIVIFLFLNYKAYLSTRNFVKTGNWTSDQILVPLPGPIDSVNGPVVILQTCLLFLTAFSSLAFGTILYYVVPTINSTFFIVVGLISSPLILMYVIAKYQRNRAALVQKLQGE
jgi:hypothetical protein